ncbi:amidohydrolase [Aliidiomarina sedimenti]|uniref:Amidohydrolase n=1 Tax=Aliidiomarina sedimenti TaxID=1933879 RepID=A0ABY0BV77_9GAMM|nr:amidohydrolase [Aliidiomarina sedimenti]RUO28014.1 amidohydrolase [Aliidiomarina sedimenti]
MMKLRHCTALLGLLVALYTPLSIAESQLYHNFTGYTFTGEMGPETNLQSFTHMVVEDGRVAAIGGDELREQFPDARAHNLAGRTLLPGLIDSHGHVQILGENLIQVDLRGINNRTATVAKVANYADANLELDWVVGRGWNQELWPVTDYPTRQDLDELINDRPVYLTRVDAHAAWVNTMALEMAGIDADTPDPDGGQIIRDEEGNPTGILIDTAMALVGDTIPEVTEETRLGALKVAQEHLLELGLTQVLDAGVSRQGLDDFKAMNENDELKLRINAMVAATDPDLYAILDEGIYLSDNHRLRIGNVKMYGDGALGSRGARLIEPYSDDPDNYGLLITPEERVRSLFEQAHEAGFQISYHAIGDYSNRLALDEFARLADEEESGSLAAYRHRIEHAQIVQLEDIPRFSELGIIPSMQPTHATSDMNMAENRIGEQRIAGAYAWRRFIDNGSIIAGGSDFPVELANPFYGIHAAVTRQDRHNQPVEGWHPEQALSLLETMRSFTIDGAWAGFADEYSGSLQVGKYADFIVVDRDPFRTSNKDLWKVQVLSTYVGGERVFHTTR